MTDMRGQDQKRRQGPARRTVVWVVVGVVVVVAVALIMILTMGGGGSGGGLYRVPTRVAGARPRG